MKAGSHSSSDGVLVESNSARKRSNASGGGGGPTGATPTNVKTVSSQPPPETAEPETEQEVRTLKQNITRTTPKAPSFSHEDKRMYLLSCSKHFWQVSRFADGFVSVKVPRITNPPPFNFAQQWRAMLNREAVGSLEMQYGSGNFAPQGHGHGVVAGKITETVLVPPSQPSFFHSRTVPQPGAGFRVPPAAPTVGKKGSRGTTRCSGKDSASGDGRGRPEVDVRPALVKSAASRLSKADTVPRSQP